MIWIFIASVQVRSSGEWEDERWDNKRRHHRIISKSMRTCLKKRWCLRFSCLQVCYVLWILLWSCLERDWKMNNKHQQSVTKQMIIRRGGERAFCGETQMISCCLLENPSSHLHDNNHHLLFLLDDHEREWGCNSHFTWPSKKRWGERHLLTLTIRWPNDR